MNAFSYASMQTLLEATLQVLEQGASPDVLRAPVNELKLMLQFRDSQLGKAIQKKARDIYSHCHDDVDIDDKPIIDYNGENGYWVMSWCYVEQLDEEETAEMNAVSEDPTSVSQSYVVVDPLYTLP